MVQPVARRYTLVRPTRTAERFSSRGADMPEEIDLAIQSLGPCRVPSPLVSLLDNRSQSVHYVEEYDRVLFDDTVSAVCARQMPCEQLPAFEPCGPRRKIFFDPSKTRAAIVTCGGLCPGLNDVIRGLTLELCITY